MRGRKRGGHGRRNGCVLGNSGDGNSEKHDSGGLIWKRIKLTSTRKANAKTRLRRVWQNEAVLRACAESDATNSPGVSNTASHSSEVKNE